MKRAEFIEKNENEQKNSGRANKWLLGYLGVFALFVVLLDKYQGDLPEDFRRSILIFSLFGGVFGILIIFGRRAEKRRRELGLCCPHCNKTLLGTSFQIVAASGRCGHCGGIVLDDWNK